MDFQRWRRRMRLDTFLIFGLPYLVMVGLLALMIVGVAWGLVVMVLHFHAMHR